MTLPLEAHRYGEHEIVMPPHDQTAYDVADVPLATRLQLYRVLQALRQSEDLVITSVERIRVEVEASMQT